MNAWRTMIRGCQSPWQRCIALFTAVMICIGFYTYGYLVLGHDFLDKYSPFWDLFESAKAAGLMVASLLVFAALRPTAEQIRSPGWTELPTGWLPIGGFVLAASALGVVFWPDGLAVQIREGRTLSVFSELFLLTAIALLALCTRRARRSDGEKIAGLRPPWLIVGMILVLVFILMEELSWGQHWLDLPTPALFQGNDQNEINLHNYYTHPFEWAYYTTAILLLVVLPFAWPRHVPDIAAGLNIFIPPPGFAILALPLCGLFYQSWNYVTNQLLLYLGVLIAADLFFRERDRAATKAIFIMVFLLVSSQIVLLDHGHLLPQGHEMAEIREVAIPLALIAYALLLLSRFRRGAMLWSEPDPSH
ncbi:MAG: hypothetical protein NXI27_12090 [Alphaproteobacteria bacterium]|nr:hypothetical protein [Alphaproteobacteria bacterium]